MTDDKQPPSVFANRVVEQIIRHMISETVKVEPQDYKVIRIVFRTLGGSWGALSDGNLAAINLLKSVVTAWGKFPHSDEKDELV